MRNAIVHNAAIGICLDFLSRVKLHNDEQIGSQQALCQRPKTGSQPKRVCYMKTFTWPNGS